VRAADWGYRCLACLSPTAVASLAAVTSLGSGAAALAGSIDGTVSFPAQLVPSMTVYAAELETSRIHTVQLARGQASFTVEVPPGRYLVFLAPNELGAPSVYGAYTQYSLCAAHSDDSKCEDHALVPVAVTAKAPRSTVTVDDWYLTDEVAAQIDRIRGVAAGMDSEPLSAPRFSEYPSAPFDSAAAPKFEFSGSELSREDREIVQQALSNGPNFAGHVTAALTSCGPACGRLLMLDWSRGQIQESAPQNPLGEVQGTLPCRPEEALLFRRDSRLLSITRMRGTAVVTQYYVWNQDTAALVQRAEYQRTAQSFCAVAAR
jgi:hypothetical protein